MASGLPAATMMSCRRCSTARRSRRLLAGVVDRVGGDDDVDLTVLDERLPVGRDGLGPVDLLGRDAQLPGKILATSTSKPSGTPSGLSRPKPGWSYLVPTVMVPASLSSAMVVPAGNSTSSATSAVFSAACSACWPASLEQPVSTRPRARWWRRSG
jgi:hypothetical protein